MPQDFAGPMTAGGGFTLASLLTHNIDVPIIGGMTKDEAIKALGGTQSSLAAALGITQGSVALWGQRPPALRQLQIEALTAGALRAGPECDKYRTPAAITSDQQQEVRDAA